MTQPRATSTTVDPSSSAKANAALLTMSLIWAVNFSVAKLALEELTPLAFNALRFPLAAAALLIMLRMRGPIPMPDRGDVKRIVLLGLLGNPLYQQFFIFGLAHSSAGSASLLLAGTPLITAILSAALGHERVKPQVWIGVFCTLIGIALVVLFGQQPDRPGENALLGAALLFSASISWAIYTVGSRSLVDRYGALPVTTWTLTAGTPLLVLVGLPDALKVDYAQLSAGMYAAILYAGVLSIGMAYAIWYYGVERLGNTRTSTYSNLVPAFALLIAWLWLGEVPRIGQIVGAAVIIGGVTLAQQAGGRRN